jgi:hypothetical protein
MAISWHLCRLRLLHAENGVLVARRSKPGLSDSGSYISQCRRHRVNNSLAELHIQKVPLIGASHEYERLFALAQKVNAGWSDYRAKTASEGRQIPVFRLKPH